METIYGSVLLRPTRIGFLVRPTQQNFFNVREFIRTCNCLWGGVFNPIIPVAKSLPKAWRRERYREISGSGLADAYIRFFEPDVFVEAEGGLAEEVGIKNLRGSFHPRIVPLKEFATTESRKHTDFAFGLSVFSIYRELYRKEFQFASRKPRKVAFVKESDPFFECVIGGFPQSPGLRYFQKAFEDVFEPTIFPATADTYLKLYRSDYFTPLHATTYELNADFQSHHDGPTIFVFDPAKTVDLIDFWNLQQFRRDVFGLNVHWFAKFEERVRKIVKANYRPLPRNKNGVMISTTVEFARSIDEAKAKALVNAHLSNLPKGSCGFKFWHDPIWRTDWRGAGVQPRRAKVYATETNFEETPSDEKQPSLRVPYIDPRFASRFSLADNHARWINVVKLSEYFAAHSEFALTFPPNAKGGEFPERRLDGSLPTREGIVVFRQFKGHGNRLRLYRKQEAVISWLKSRGIEAEPSAAGRNAEQILRSNRKARSGGLFADEGTVKLLDKMARTLREGEDGVIAQYPDRTASIAEWKQVLGKRSNAVWTKGSLRDFTEANVIRIGITLPCPHCAKVNWFSLTDLDYSLACERCLKAFPFPQAGIKFNESDWRYRVVGPYSLPHYADGAYATILTLRLLNQTLYSSDTPTVLSTGLMVKLDESNFEIDFAGWYSEGNKFWVDRVPVVVFGETKSFGNEVFLEKDVQRLKALAERIPGSYVVFAAMKNELSATEKARIRKFAEWGRVPQKNHEPRAMVIVLTGIELFSDHSIRSTWEKVGGAHAEKVKPAYVNIDDLWELANITQQLYLDMPSYWSWREKRRRKRRPKVVS